MRGILIINLEVERLMQEDQSFWASLSSKMSMRFAYISGLFLSNNNNNEQTNILSTAATVRNVDFMWNPVSDNLRAEWEP